jgi:hypothetical protein
VSGGLASQKLESRQSDMQKFESNIGLYKFPAQIQECEQLTLTGEDIKMFTAEQCDEAAMDLANYSMYIQRVFNKEKSIVRWLEAKINLTIASELNSYEGYYSHEQRRYVAIVNNSYAKELEEFRINSQMKVDMLDGLNYQINQQCKVLLEAKYTKKQIQKHY